MFGLRFKQSKLKQPRNDESWCSPEFTVLLTAGLFFSPINLTNKKKLPFFFRRHTLIRIALVLPEVLIEWFWKIYEEKVLLLFRLEVIQGHTIHSTTEYTQPFMDPQNIEWKTSSNIYRTYSLLPVLWSFMGNNKVNCLSIGKAVLSVDNITNSYNGFPVLDTCALHKIDMSEAQIIPLSAKDVVFSWGSVYLKYSINIGASTNITFLRCGTQDKLFLCRGREERNVCTT